MERVMHDGDSSKWSSRGATFLLLTYGLAVLLYGAALLAAPGWTTVVEAGTSSEFVSHLNQSRAGSVLGLAVLALIAAISARPAFASRDIFAALALTNLLMAMILGLTQMTPMAAPERWLAVAVCFFWAIGFALVGARAAAAPAEAPHHDTLLKAAVVTYAIFTGIEGLAWLLAPGLLGQMMITQFGGATPYAGLVRGAVDLPIAIIAWNWRGRIGLPSGLALTAALVMANLVLAGAGLLAQLHTIATPSRWAVEGLHIVWFGAFAWALVQPLLSGGSKPAFAPSVH